MNRVATEAGTKDTYEQVPQAQRERLFRLRRAHPYQRLDANGTTWRYVAWGEGERVLLFLPGAFLKADMWLNQILALERYHPIIAPDAYALQGIFNLERVCRRIVESLDAERVQRAR